MDRIRKLRALNFSIGALKPLGLQISYNEEEKRRCLADWRTHGHAQEQLHAIGNAGRQYICKRCRKLQKAKNEELKQRQIALAQAEAEPEQQVVSEAEPEQQAVTAAEAETKTEAEKSLDEAAL